MSTATTHIETDKQLVPASRFKEFEGSWIKKKLIDWKLVVLDGDRGSNYPSGGDFQPEGYCLFMNAKNVTKTGFSFEERMFITKEKDELLRKGKLKREDLVLTTRGSVGHIAYYEQSIPFENLRINSGMVVIRNENKLINSKFIYVNFHTPSLIRQVSTIAFGSAQPQLTVKEINKFKFNIPSLPEQQKIASFLSAVDEKIQQLTKKKALLEQYKKGVMQQLFSGQLRFKDDTSTSLSAGNENPYPDWEEKKLGEIAEIVGGGTPETVKPDYWDGEIQWFTPTEIRSKYISNSKRTITQLGLSKSAAKILPAGTILFTSRATIAELGFATQECTTNQGFQSLIVNENNVSEFIYQLIKINKNEFVRKSQGSTFLEISSKEMKKMKFNFPCYEEQQKIATYLSSIDTKIEAVNNQITQTQTFKKGLLQQMFV